MPPKLVDLILWYAHFALKSAVPVSHLARDCSRDQLHVSPELERCELAVGFADGGVQECGRLAVDVPLDSGSAVSVSSPRSVCSQLGSSASARGFASVIGGGGSDATSSQPHFDPDLERCGVPDDFGDSVVHGDCLLEQHISMPVPSGVVDMGDID